MNRRRLTQHPNRPAAWMIALAVGLSFMAVRSLEAASHPKGRAPVIQEDFESFKVGPWTPPDGVLTRGPLFIEAPEVSPATHTKALATRGLMRGERFVLTPVVDGNMTYDVDIQRLEQVLDTDLMWRVNVNPESGAQTYYQASIGYGRKGLEPTVCRIQIITEDSIFPSGFVATTLAEADGPILHRDEWHHVQVKVVGDHGVDTHILSIDGVEVVRAADNTLAGGRIGGRVGGDMTHWDNIVVTSDP